MAAMSYVSGASAVPLLGETIGQRLDPATDGRPDSRPGVRETPAVLGDLALDFDFSQRPRPPMLLPVRPRTDLTG